LDFDATIIDNGAKFLINNPPSIGSTYTDDWGTTYKKTGASWPIDSPVDFPIKDKRDFKKFKPPDPDKPELYEDIKVALESADDIAVISMVGGTLTRAWLLTGWTCLSHFMFEELDIFESLLKMAGEYWERVLENMIELGIHCAGIGDDLGFNSGTFFSPEIYKKYLFPLLKRQVDICKRNNVPVYFHCDGNNNSIMEDIINIGFDALNPIAKNANMDLEIIKKEYGESITLHGTVESSILLPFGEVEDIIKETKKNIKIGGKNGRFIMGVDSDVRDDIPIKNIMAMYNTIKESGNYPIRIQIC